jgi:hypothetical protein
MITSDIKNTKHIKPPILENASHIFALVFRVVILTLFLSKNKDNKLFGSLLIVVGTYYNDI